jgi:hypothetical protein
VRLNTSNLLDVVRCKAFDRSERCCPPVDPWSSKADHRQAAIEFLD